MALIFNLTHLAKRPLHLRGTLSLEELDIDPLDEMIHLHEPLGYELVIEKLANAVWVQGRLRLALECECVRCLRAYRHLIDLAQWSCYLPLRGAESVTVINDCIDLTPFIREDILLAFPQHPLCEPGCKGLAAPDPIADPERPQVPWTGSSWADLDKLKIEE